MTLETARTPSTIEASVFRSPGAHGPLREREIDGNVGVYSRPMRTPLHRSLRLLALIAIVGSSSTAQADLLPDAARPDWDEQPKPLPEPPPEKELPIAVVTLFTAALLGAVLFGRRVAPKAPDQVSC